MKKLGPLVAFALVLSWHLFRPLDPAESQQPSDPSPASDPPSAGDVQQTVDETVSILQNTQQQEDSWAADKAELQQRYRDLKAQLAYLTQRRTVAEQRVAALEANVNELQRRLDESARLRTGLSDTLISIFAGLENHVAGGLPFLPYERNRRVSSLREDLVRPDVDVAEKLRRLLEALLIEAGYGSSLEVYPDDIAVDGDTLAVDVLRLGRLSLFWRTPDAARAGVFDPGGKGWAELDGSARNRIGLAMDMVSRRRLPDVVALPLGRVEP